MRTTVKFVHRLGYSVESTVMFKEISQKLHGSVRLRQFEPFTSWQNLIRRGPISNEETDFS